MAAGLLRPLPRRPAAAQAPDPGLLLWTPGPDRVPRPVTPGCPLAGQAGALLPAQTGLFSEEEDEAAGTQACLPPVPPDTTPKHSEQRMGWAFVSPRPEKEDAALFWALPRDCVLHSAPQGRLAHARASFLPVPSWAKYTCSCPALVESPTGNLPATPCLLQQLLLPQASASCLWEGRALPLSPSLQQLQPADFLSPSAPGPPGPNLSSAGTALQRPGSEACFRACNWVG